MQYSVNYLVKIYSDNVLINQLVVKFYAIYLRKLLNSLITFYATIQNLQSNSDLNHVAKKLRFAKIICISEDDGCNSFQCNITLKEENSEMKLSLKTLSKDNGRNVNMQVFPFKICIKFHVLYFIFSSH